MYYIGSRVEHWYYGKGVIVSKEYDNTLKVKLDVPKDGYEYKELKYNELIKLF